MVAGFKLLAEVFEHVLSKEFAKEPCSRLSDKTCVSSVGLCFVRFTKKAYFIHFCFAEEVTNDNSLQGSSTAEAEAKGPTDSASTSTPDQPSENTEEKPAEVKKAETENDAVKMDTVEKMDTDENKEQDKETKSTEEPTKTEEKSDNEEKKSE